MRRIALWVGTIVSVWVGTAWAGTMTVTSLADDGDGICDATCTLRDAVISAASGDQIVFSNSLTYPDAVYLGGQEILLYKSLSIVGPGADKLSIDGDNSSRLFELVANASVSFSGLTLTQGRVSGTGGAGPSSTAQGGAFFVGAGSTLALWNCVVSYNHVFGGQGSSGPGGPAGSGGDAYGGAIFSTGTLQIHGTRFSNNGALGGPGGMGFPGGFANGGTGGNALGGALYSSGQTEILGSQFSDNGTLGGPGGAAGPGAQFSGSGGSTQGGAMALGNFAFVAFSSMALNFAQPGVPGSTISGGGGTLPGNTGSAYGSDVTSNATLLSRYTIFDSTQPSVASSCSVANMLVQGNNLDADSSCAGFTLHAADHFVVATDALGTLLRLPWGSAAIDSAADCKDPFGIVQNLDLIGSTRPLDGNADHVAACDLGGLEADYLFVNGFEVPIL